MFNDRPTLLLLLLLLLLGSGMMRGNKLTAQPPSGSSADNTSRSSTYEHIQIHISIHRYLQARSGVEREWSEGEWSGVE